MRRVPEPELMDDPAQALAYTGADFSEPHGMFIDKFRDLFPKANITGNVLDLGCGPADIAIRFARAYPRCHIDGVDGADCMLVQGELAIRKAKLTDRIRLLKGVLPDAILPHREYEVILSNSLLHHLHEPAVLWECIKDYAVKDAIVFIMDLMRPDSGAMARQLVNTYAVAEPLILQRDFYNSLCAAFTPGEVVAQLGHAGLSQFRIETISDRHFIVFGQF
ncbi:MAG: hypothetical protein HW411_306 [Gammaproteobacteria bacterium]|nr:hypothetical protein [Gammaproteobacteria bacterium]